MIANSWRGRQLLAVNLCAAHAKHKADARAIVGSVIGGRVDNPSAAKPRRVARSTDGASGR